ncbi:biotin holocarboxylase synthetase, variant 2 [Orbilia ellipsospora]|uniref:Biotin holocarboxylase synthetase, variant 2 n=1 Tax=Orbilia ellipsospora TaxID=2528407 RepID=A0AAV9XN78_9PEZI
MNVLVYSGSGTTVESVTHCLNTFQRLLSPHYAVSSIDGDTISRGQWLATCALLCLPGGADLGFCKALNGQGNRYIKQYVRRGGRYIGFCAGAYFASANIEFEKGNQSLEVTGARELAFFPGFCHGAAYNGFAYNSETGARACTLNVTGSLLEMGSPQRFKTYYNGGGIFVGADNFKDEGIEILAKYQEEPHLRCKGDAAAVGCKIGAGYAILISTHPEYDIEYLRKSLRTNISSGIIDELEANEPSRLNFMKTILKLFGLKFNNQAEHFQPPLSDLYLSFLDQAGAQELIGKLIELANTENNKYEQKLVVCESDIFLIEYQSMLVGALERTVSDIPSLTGSEQTEKSIFRIKIPEACHHSTTETPYFDSAAYFRHLATERALCSTASRFGSPLLYGEVVTSTSTLLEKYFPLDLVSLSVATLS